MDDGQTGSIASVPTQGVREGTFMQQLPDRPKSRLFVLQKGIAMIESMAIPFRNYAHRLRVALTAKWRYVSEVFGVRDERSGPSAARTRSESPQPHKLNA